MLLAPDSMPGMAENLASLPMESLRLLPKIPWDGGLRKSWNPGEAGALERLDAFMDASLAGYQTQRDRPDVDGVSRLSPHLHFGEIGPRQIVQVLAGAHRNLKDTEAYLRELGWREFAHHLLYHFPHTRDQPMDERFRHFHWAESDPALLNAWQRGQTGIPLVDAGMRQLWHCGWMHNRVRMVVASFLTKNLRMHWLEGARWFWDTLVDADLASNSLGWQWVAGCGADAAPYFRIFNPVLQGERFDPEGGYVRRWVPELANLPNRYLHKPWEAPETVLESAGVQLGVHYPQPMVDLKQSRELALQAFANLPPHPPRP
jgi:deoxyribodipyrimidine photo-lyase